MSKQKNKPPELTDSYVKKLLKNSCGGLLKNIKDEDIPEFLVLRKREDIKNLRFTREVERKLKRIEKQGKGR